MVPGRHPFSPQVPGRVHKATQRWSSSIDLQCSHPWKSGWSRPDGSFQWGWGAGGAMSGDILGHHNWELILALGEWRPGMLGCCWTLTMPRTAPRINGCLICNINKTSGIKSLPLSVCPPSRICVRKVTLDSTQGWGWSPGELTLC